MTIAQLLKDLYDNLVLANSVTNEFVQALPLCYSEVSNKGGTLPAQQSASNLPSAIASIPTSSIPINPGYVTTLHELSDYAKTCDVYGAVLSKETEGEHTGKYIIWNDVPGEQTWDPRGTDSAVPIGHGTNKAICIGNGIWLIVDWTGLTNYLAFARDDTSLNRDFLVDCVQGSGKDNSDYILSHYLNEADAETNYPMWYALKQLREANNGELVGAYIPNSHELHLICWKLSDIITNTTDYFQFTTNISNLFVRLPLAFYYFWSSTQYPSINSSGGNVAIILNTGNLNSMPKGNNFYSFACLSFD